jgi:hypothetical protein
MELPIHVERSSPSRAARWIPSVRAVALLTLGVGIGVLASIPFGGDQTSAAVVAILAASAAAALVVLRPRNTLAVGVADVLLGIAVMATAFGRLGPLYIPLLLAFFAVTARVERPARYTGAHLRWEPAPEYQRVGRHALDAPARRVPDEVWLPPSEPQVVHPAATLIEPRADAAWLPLDSPERPTWLSELGPVTDQERPAAVAGDVPAPGIAADDIGSEARIDVVSSDETAERPGLPRVGPAALAALRMSHPADEASTPDLATYDVAATTPPPGGPPRRVVRRRTMPAARKMMSAAGRARRAVSFHAKVGFENLRAALAEESIDPDLPPWPEGHGTPDDHLIVLPESDLVAAGLRSSAGAGDDPAPGWPATARARLRARTVGRSPRMHRSDITDDAV